MMPRCCLSRYAPLRCCRYFEPQVVADKAGYPFPFAPSTHLYRDDFSGFVSTLRSSRARTSPPAALHYLHEIVMNRQGDAVVAGEAAPQPLVDDLTAMKQLLAPIAVLQPFFGGFANVRIPTGLDPSRPLG